MTETRLFSRRVFTRGLALAVACLVVGQLGCGRSKTVVDEGPAVEAKAPPIQWTMRAVKAEDFAKKEGERALNDAEGGAAPREGMVKRSEAKDGPAPATRTPPVPSPAPANGETRKAEPKAPSKGRPGQDEATRVYGDDDDSKLKAGEKGEAKKPGEKGPQTWQRDRKRPTFARVYVGDGNTLQLVGLQVTTTIDGPRARTVVDHIFHNPHDRRLEGTFEYPLPSGASPSYFAMFLGQSRDSAPPRFAGRGDQPPLPAEALARLTPNELVKHVSSTDWGTLQEGRIVSKERALETYEDIVRSQIDPALLEYAGGNTFSGRVFPIQPKGYNRVLIAYEELLPVVGGKVLYRYPLPDCKLNELQYTLQIGAADCKEPAFEPDDARKEDGGSRLAWSRTWKDRGPGGEVRFAFTSPRPQHQAISGRQVAQGPIYLYARVRPELEVKADRPFAEHAVFLLDTSLSEHPDRFAANMKLLKKILESDAAIKQFNILAFNVGAAWVEPKGWLPNTAAGREKAFSQLDGIVLEAGADLSAALAELTRLVPTGGSASSRPALTQGTPLNVFLLSDGQITWGEPEVGPLVASFENFCPFPTRFHCYRTGLGADNLELFEALTRKGGGIFNCYTEADLPAAAQAHRHQCLQVERVRLVGGPEASEVLVAGRKAAVYPGGELIVAGKLNGAGKTRLVVEGSFRGQPYSQEYPIEVAGTNELAPRGWGEIAVASLLALNDPRLDSLVTAYCQEFSIGSRVASFLVLEDPKDYRRLNLEEERGKTVPGGDVAAFLADAWNSMGKPLPPKEAFERFLARIEPRIKLLGGENGAHVKKLLGLLTDKDFDVAGSAIPGAILRKSDALAAYLKAREADPRNVETYLVEARRRTDAQDAGGAVRVLSSIVEEYPGRSDALRLVGYRLLDLRQPAQAVGLFRQVQHSRPFEPHSYRDLARSLEESGNFGLAAVQYEIVLAGNWHSRFRDSLKLVAREEYARMMQEAIRLKAVSKELIEHFGERLERMANPQPKSDLRVTISWNTDATDVDLWVLEPDGSRCFYGHNKTAAGGELSDDQTQGYGPERYQMPKARSGEFVVLVHYFRANPTLLAGETHVNVVITRNAGSPDEIVERRTVILKKNDDLIEVAKIKFGPS